jgi:hypothetical protein
VQRDGCDRVVDSVREQQTESGEPSDESLVYHAGPWDETGSIAIESASRADVRAHRWARQTEDEDELENYDKYARFQVNRPGV